MAPVHHPQQPEPTGSPRVASTQSLSLLTLCPGLQKQPLGYQGSNTNPIGIIKKKTPTSVCASAHSSCDPALSTASPLGQPRLLLISTRRPEPSMPERSSLAFSPQSVQYMYLGKRGKPRTYQRNSKEVNASRPPPSKRSLPALTPSRDTMQLPLGCPSSARPKPSSSIHPGCPLQSDWFLCLSNTPCGQ